MIGRTISHYTVLEKIGEGGMGVVYKARDRRLARLVAIKFLHPTALRSERRRERFLREARAAASLDHPNICTIYEIDEVDGQFFLVMAVAEGRSLESLVGDGPLDPQRAVSIAIQVLRGLQAAHRRGIVHRDVKSSNVVVSEAGEAKILDFGLARVKEGPEASTTTAGVGTPAYMSPEQIRGDPVDPRSDLWSWGVVLYEMLAGRLPFEGDNVGAVIHAILHREPTPIERLRPELPTGLGRIVRRALARRPEDRYPDAAAVLADLRAPERVAEPRDGGAEDDRRPSIAVLPFADLSPGGDQGYFCDGLAEEITNDLARLGRLRVASRTSAFAYKGRFDDVRQIGRRLDVGTVLEGSVRKAGERLRITAQLIDVASGYHLWSEQYDRQLEDVFAIQEQIGKRIVEALQVELSAGERRALEAAPTRDVRAYDLYLRGKQYFYRTRRDSVDIALEMFAQAARQDPRFAPAFAGMSTCHAYRFLYFGGGPAELERALETSQRALELDPDRAESHVSCGLAASLDGRHDEAERHFEEAIRIHPGLFEAYYLYARVRLARGQLDEATRMYAQALRVSPHEHQTPGFLGMIARRQGREDEARRWYALAVTNLDRYLQLNPDDARAVYLKAQALVEVGSPQEAIAWGERAAALAPDDPYITYGLACVHARLGRVETSLRHLGRAVDEGFAHREWIDNDPDLDLLREDPRFVALRDRSRRD